MAIAIGIHESLDLDGSLRKPTMDFLLKLAEDPTAPGLHIEPIANSADPRVRTGRVNLQYRAVLFEITEPNSRSFMLVGVYPHDEGIEKAKKVTLRVNPFNGVTELIEKTSPVEPGKAEIESRRKAAEAAAAAEATARKQAEKTEVVSKGTEVALPVNQPRPGEQLTQAGHTPELLEAELGIDPDATRIVLNLESESALDTALAASPLWERDALSGLVAGLSIEEVRQSLDITTRDPEAETDERSEDERLHEGLQTPAASMEWAYLEDVNTDSLRQVIDSRDFDRWRTYIHPGQKSMVKRDFSGSARIFGGAGTGKTVVVVHRANHLLTRGGSLNGLQGDSPRVLLTTFTRGLADSLKSQMNVLNPTFPEASHPGDQGLWIGGIDSVAYQVLAKAPMSEVGRASEMVLGRAARRVKAYTGDEERTYWLDALMVADQSDLPGELANTEFLKQEFESVVLANQITTEKDYLRVARPGRGTALSRANRKKIWVIINAYMNASARDGKLAWPALSAVAATLLDNRATDGGSRLFDHVLIDEAQDFHAGHWRFLRACVDKSANDIFLAEDSHQRIYGQHHVLSHFGISTRGRASTRLTLNYRTTRQNLDYALGMLTGEWVDSEGEEDTMLGYRSARSGPLPKLYRFESEADEFDATAELIGNWQEENPEARIGILARSRPLINRVVNALADHGISAVKTKNAELAAHETVSVMTMHGAKGMEFTHVIMLGMGRDLLPQQHQLKGLGEGERKDALQRERALLYVAASRARDALVLTTHTEPTELLPVAG